ncbi:MAG: EamA family transporter RarD [Burkholderiaceae bacterium]
MKISSQDKAIRNGLIAATLAFSVWGLYPIFYKQLSAIAPAEVMAHRVVWSFVFLAVGMLFMPGGSNLRSALKSGKTAWLVLLAAGFISINWFVFIYAVAHDRILEASLGYFLNPVLSSLLGRLFLGERQNRWQSAAVMFAGAGMTITFLVAGVVPWLSLIMAASFAVYSLVRKQSALDSTGGLFLETLVLVPAACLYLWIIDGQFLGHGPTLAFWLVAAGVLTLVPLLSVVYAARRIELGTLGFFQYIAPTTHFFIAVGLYQEPVDLARLMAFATTVIAVGLFITGVISNRRSRRNTGR